MGPSYRTSYQAKQEKEVVDLEARVLSPRGSLVSPSFPHASSFRRRRSHSRRACKWITAGVFTLCLVGYILHISSHVNVLHSQQLDYEPIDVVAVSLKPSCVTREAITSLNRYLQPRAIHIITTSSVKCSIFSLFADNVVCHLQDKFLDGVTVDRVGDFLQRRLGLDQHKRFKGRDLSGWYMQQFLKLGSVLALPGLSIYYVVWDLDMILLSPVQLVWRDRELPGGGLAGMSASVGQTQTLVNIGGSVAPGYMASFQRLTKHGLEFAPDGTSFVTHWMVIYKPYLLEFLRELSNDGDGPTDWVWRILGAVEPRYADLGFSEYASYISWVRQHYPQSQRLASRKTWVRHPFGQRTLSLLRLLRTDRCCCPNGLLLWLLRLLGFVYTGYEVGHIPECRYDASEHAMSYGL